MHHVAVIDIGKTNAKLAIVDATQRREIDVVTTPNKLVQGPPYPHFDVPAIWQFIVESLKSFANKYEIKAITVTTHGACVVLLDEQGKLATPVLDYEHSGPDECRTAYETIRPPFYITGSPPLAGGLNVGAQIYWLYQEQPQLQHKVHSIVMYPQYWTYLLCGVLANEPTSLGAHTDLWIPAEGCLSALADRLNITNKIATPVPSTSVLGTVTTDVSHATGLPADTPVYCGIHDSNASLYTHLTNLQPPFSVVSTGTWVVCMTAGSNTTDLDETRDTLINVSVAGTPVPSAKFMGGREYDYLSTTYNATPTSKVITGVLQKDAFVLPSVESSTGPFPRCDYQWTFDPDLLSAEERYNVISFYLALMTTTCLNLCDSTGPIIVEGPFTKNIPYCAMLHAATDREVSGDTSGSTGTSIGAAILAYPAPANFSGQYRSLTDGFDRTLLKAYSEQWQARTLAHTAQT